MLDSQAMFAVRLVCIALHFFTPLPDHLQRLIQRPRSPTQNCLFAPIGMLLLFVLPVIWLVMNFNREQEPSSNEVPLAAPALLERILERKTLRVATREGPLTWYKNDTGDVSGLDADLVRLFAASLGVEVEFIVAPSIPAVLDLVRTDQADMAAAGLMRDTSTHTAFRVSSSYLKLRQQLLMHDDGDKPSKLGDLKNAYISVVAGSGHGDTAHKISEINPSVVTQTLNAASSMDLVAKLARKELDYVLLDASMARMAQMRFPEVRLALDIGEPKEYAWLFAPSTAMCNAEQQIHAAPCKGQDNDSLVQAAEDFLFNIKQSGELQRIIDGYFDYLDTLDPDGSRQFLRAVRYQLDPYRPHFMQAGQKHKIDWRLLAATGYQESKWDPGAVSNAGVRGMMQFTQGTAEKLGIDPHDPRSSIEGAARYLKILDQQLPRSIPASERPWFALAAYNIGIGTVLHALRSHQRKHPKETIYWQDFKDSLLMETQGSSFSLQRRKLALHYVDSIRGYYELLVWLTERAPSHS